MCLSRSSLIIVSHCHSGSVREDVAISERRQSSHSTKQLENDSKWINLSVITLRCPQHAKKTLQLNIKPLCHTFKLKSCEDFHKHYIFIHTGICFVKVPRFRKGFRMDRSNFLHELFLLRHTAFYVFPLDKFNDLQTLDQFVSCRGKLWQHFFIIILRDLNKESISEKCSSL